MITRTLDNKHVIKQIFVCLFDDYKSAEPTSSKLAGQFSPGISRVPQVQVRARAGVWFSVPRVGPRGWCAHAQTACGTSGPWGLHQQEQVAGQPGSLTGFCAPREALPQKQGVPSRNPLAKRRCLYGRRKVQVTTLPQCQIHPQGTFTPGRTGVTKSVSCGDMG